MAKTKTTTRGQHPNDVPSPHPLVPSEQLLPSTYYVFVAHCNPRLNTTTFVCPHPVLLAIIEGHYLRSLLCDHPTVPLLYLQQFWRTLSLNKAEKPTEDDYFTAIIDDNLQIRFDLDLLRIIFKLRGPRQFPGKTTFDPLPSRTTIPHQILYLGYNGVPGKLTDIKIPNFPSIWSTLLLMINKCFSGKTSGLDHASLRSLIILHGFALDYHYDYAHLIWTEFCDLVKQKSTFAYIPYQRFFQIIIQYFMDEYDVIP